MMTRSENDFKYVIQNFSDVFIGLFMTYKELADAEDTPQRLKTALYQYVIPEAGEEIRICDHLLRIDDASKAYMVFSQLKGKFRVMVQIEKKNRKGEIRTEYREKTVSVAELVSDEQLKSQITPELVLECKFSKLHLAALSV